MTHPESPRMMTFKSTFFLDVIFLSCRKTHNNLRKFSIQRTYQCPNFVIVKHSLITSCLLLGDNKTQYKSESVSVQTKSLEHSSPQICTKSFGPWTNHISLRFISVMCFLSCWANHEEHIIPSLTHHRKLPHRALTSPYYKYKLNDRYSHRAGRLLRLGLVSITMSTVELE